LGPPAAMPPVGMALPRSGRAYGRGEQGARARLTCVAALRRSFGFAKGAPRANGSVALRCRRRFLHPRRRTKVLRVGEKTSKKAKSCFMQHLKVTFNRFKADIFSRFTTSNTCFFAFWSALNATAPWPCRCAAGPMGAGSKARGRALPA